MLGDRNWKSHLPEDHSSNHRNTDWFRRLQPNRSKYLTNHSCQERTNRKARKQCNITDTNVCRELWIRHGSYRKLMILAADEESYFYAHSAVPETSADPAIPETRKNLHPQRTYRIGWFRSWCRRTLVILYFLPENDPLCRDPEIFSWLVNDIGTFQLW